ncbi:sensor histidine kinase [Phytomonospora endophytica]|uniref:histidine kinase n=1 Tax=Phytomonospora endophytica TaxID=714109 RepID=A0A841FLH8_9ACTN|nr:HAMP domain-containing sensor histidine kinase [Phytomonospora endophytica]MBB6036815.1 hypothetical protein [Phytomonospora endophytica]GIG68151.1 sensor protein CutS [Phytomonospora endophytica]
MDRKFTGRSVGLRFTLLYTALFLLSGAALLVLVNALAFGDVSSSEPVGTTPGGLEAARRQVEILQDRLNEVESGQAQRVLSASILAFAVMAAVSLVLGRVIASRVLRPLRTITAATRRITADRLHERLTVPGPDDEVKDLADTIDGLLERLESAFTAQRRFVANASHELRTPLTTMRASVDVAVAKPGPVPAQTTALAARVRGELDRVDALLDGFLGLARAQHGALGERTPVDLSALVRDAIADHAEDIVAKGLTLSEDLCERAIARGDGPLLARVAQNLIDNAVAHNGDGGWIRVATRADDRKAGLTVETGGPILDPVEAARLTEPFLRLGTARTGAGSGLGLSIVAAVAEAHGGRLDVAARSEGGLRVTVTLPAAGIGART